MSHHTFTLPKLNSRNLPWPVHWPDLFGADRPLILEIGFGQGHMLLHLAQQHPDSNIVGLEISNRCLVRAEERIVKRSLHNVRVIHAPAETALNHLFAPDSLSEVHINFPDPWFKSRHEHRRLMQRSTVDVIINRLKPGARLYLATDIIEYAEMSAELLAETPQLDNVLDTPWTSAVPGRTPTKYEQKARREGRDCYFFIYQRNDQPGPAIPVIKEMVMPHVVLESPLSFEAIQDAFEPIEHNEPDLHINVQYVYQGKRALLFETHVKEPTIDQRVALNLLTRDTPGELTLQLSMLGHPRPTAGVHAAANLIADWLLSLHPDTRIIKRKTRSTED